MNEIKIGIRQALILYASPEFINVRSTRISRNHDRPNAQSREKQQPKYRATTIPAEFGITNNLIAIRPGL